MSFGQSQACAIAAIILGFCSSPAYSAQIHPHFLGEFDPGSNGLLQESTPVGDYLYLTDVRAGMRILDVRDPSSILQVKQLGDDRGGITSANGFVFTYGNGSINIYSVTNPLVPVIVGSIRTGGLNMRRPIVKDSILYVSVNEVGFFAYDITNPSSPQQLYHTDFGLNLSNVGLGTFTVGKNFAYVFTPNLPVLSIISIADPANIFRISTHSPPLSSSSSGDLVHLGGDTVLLTSAGYIMQLIDYSNPFSPAIVDWVEVSPNRSYGQLVECEGFVYACGQTLSIFDVRNRSQIRLIANRNMPYGNRASVSISGHRLFCVELSEKLQIYSVGTHLANPQIAGQFGVSNHGYDLVQDGNAVYMSTFNSVLSYDSSDPTAPTFGGTVISGGTGGGFQDLEISGSSLFVGDHANNRLIIFDVTQPHSPNQVGVLSLGDDPDYIKAHGNVLYVGAGSQGLLILDISTPSSPTLAGSLGDLRNTWHIGIANGKAYVSYREGLKILDLSNALSPTVVGAFLPGFGRTSAVNGSTVYFSTLSEGFYVLDFSNLFAPVVLAHIEPGSSSIADMAYHEGFVYEMFFGSGIRVIDVRNPSASAVVSSSPVVRGSRLSLINGHLFATRVKASDVATTNSPVNGGAARVNLHLPDAGPTEIGIDGGADKIRWKGIADVDYQILSSNDLANWNNHGGVTTGTNGAAEAGISSSNRFDFFRLEIR